jgi:hypothetical protein
MTVGGGTSNSTSGFALMLGGGLDIGLRKGFGFRVVQADWISTNFSGPPAIGTFALRQGL